MIVDPRLVWKENRAFAHHGYWECFREGFYTKTCDHSREIILLSQLLLQSPERFAERCAETIRTWPISAAVHLSNGSINRRAWLGQSACYVAHGACPECTKAAWRSMTEDQQNEANRIATEAMEKWATEPATSPQPNRQLDFPF